MSGTELIYIYFFSHEMAEESVGMIQESCQFLVMQNVWKTEKDV